MAGEPDAPASLPGGALSGTVVEAGDPVLPVPIARARVILTSAALEEPRVAITRDDGTFDFEQLPPGEYHLAASASGYARQAYLQRRTGTPAPITLPHGERRSGVEVPLPRAGVIVGQILDEDGRPFVGATVNALRSRMEGGQATMLSLATATTDDRGEFRLTGLAAGQYYVSAFDPSFGNVGDHRGPLRYTATYFPGVVFVEQATRVSVIPGQEAEVRAVFKLQIIRPARLTGRLTLPDAGRLATGAVMLAPLHGEGLATMPSNEAELLPNGRFTFRNVPPGFYEIRARGETGPGAIPRFASYRVQVSGRDLSNLDMVLRPGARLDGTVSYEAVQTRRPERLPLRVRAPFADGSSFGDTVTGEVADDGRYEVRGLMPGVHVVTLEGLTYPWVVKEVRWQGQDITDTGLEVAPRDVVPDVRITITDVTTEVTGTVTDLRGRPVADALVLVIPLAPQFWSRLSRRFGLLTSTEDGTYRVRGLPAGEYRVAATLELDESEIYRKDILRKFAAEGRALTLEDRQSVALDLTLISLSALSTPPR